MSIIVVSGNKAEELVVNCGRTVKLNYPSNWRAGERTKSVWLLSAEAELRQWINERKFIEADSQQTGLSGAIVKALSAANVGAMCAPNASFFAVMAMSKFMTLMALWDDEVIEVGELTSVEPVRQSLYDSANRNQSPALEDKWANHFYDFGSYIVDHSGASVEYMKRLSDGICQWALNSQFEQSICANLAPAGSVCGYPLEHFVKQRTGTIGMDIFARLLEIGSGFELAQEISSHPNYKRLLGSVNLAIACINDLASAGKDCDQRTETEDYRWSNLMWTHFLLTRPASVQTSIEWTVELHNKAIEEFDVLVSSLDSWIVNPVWIAKMEAYCQCLRQLIVGMAQWHGTAPRYQTKKVYDVDNHRVYLMTFV